MTDHIIDLIIEENYDNVYRHLTYENINITLFDCFIDQHLGYFIREGEISEKYILIMKLFLSKQELVFSDTSIENMISRLIELSHFNIIRKDTIDIYDMFVNHKNIKESDTYSRILTYIVDNLLKNVMVFGTNIKNNHFIKILDLLFKIPEYDMEMNVKHPIDVCFDYMSFISYHDSAIVIIKMIVDHKSFKLLQRYIDQCYIYECCDQLLDIFNEHINNRNVRLFVTIVAHTDEYFKTDNRFFNITKQLPMELQMIIANRTYGIMDDNISSCNINKYINSIL